MNLEHLELNLQKRRDAWGTEYTLGFPCTELQLDAAERQLSRALPEQVRAFYRTCNGLTVKEPPFVIVPIADLCEESNGLVLFAFAEPAGRIAFAVSKQNAGGQWDIVNADSRLVITHSMASFWSNKIWKWIDRRLRFWEDELFEPVRGFDFPD